MLGGAPFPIDDAANAYALWWREAGFHTPVSDDAHDLRALAATAPPPAGQAAPAPPAPPRAMPPQPPAPATGLPETLPAFLDWLARDETQPDARWMGAPLLPPARAEAPLLIILDLPGAALVDAEMPVDADQQRVLAAMLGAIGMTPQRAAFATLATRRPAGGLIDDATLTLLGGRMRHYLGLARPEAALLIGDRTNRALLGAPAAAHAGRLSHVNHANGSLPAAILPALDLLMKRPAIKARSWQTLRLLNGVLH